MNRPEHPSSFRDPSGFIFTKNGDILRQVNFFYKDSYDHLIQSGLYKRLVEENLIIPHVEDGMARALTKDAYKIILPESLSFVSYPYEWCFSQLKAAALTTLRIQKLSLDYGMSLKDASAFNIQFHRGRALLIDTLSFEKYQEGRPWVAYQQFCKHFVSPLALMRYRDRRLNKLSQQFIDGIPLDLAFRLFGWYRFFSPTLFVHIFLHHKSQERFSESRLPVYEKRKFGLRAFQALIENLERGIQNMRLVAKRSFWRGYYERQESYSPESLKHKENIVLDFLQKSKPKTVWDLGSNMGEMSRLASRRNIFTVSFDYDHDSVEENFQISIRQQDRYILPLVQDITNPSPSLGWEGKERQSLLQRSGADCVLALALLHHLSIGNNISFSALAEFFHSLCNWLIIEYVPKSDLMVRRMLALREDIFRNYTKDAFDNAFSRYFRLQESQSIHGSSRILYLMRRK